MSSDQIAYLRDLANSYFQEGNLSAAISTWEQVLGMDPSNVEARQGITLAQMKQQGISQDPGPAQDPDATMMFSLGEQPFGAPAEPVAPGGGFDAERTMMFGGAPAQPAPPGGGFDAERTMMFGGSAAPPPAAPPAAPAGGGFDADRTMMFNPAGAPAAPAAPAAPGFDAERTMMFGGAPAPPPAAPTAPPGFDADRTMAFNPSLAPPAAPPAWQPPAAPAPAPAPTPGADWLKPSVPVPDADSTMMSPPTTPDFGFAPPPPSAFGTPTPPAPPGPGFGSKPLEDFALPAAPPAFTAPGMGAGPGLPPPPGGTGGFSFELPPPPSKGAGGMPDLPSVGFSPPPTFTPAPPPPPVAGLPKKAGGQFGEVDPGEIESLQVPTLAPSAPAADDATRSAREDQLKAEYANQYGKTQASLPQAPPRPPPPSRPAVSPKFLVGFLVVVAVVLGGGYFGFQWWEGRKPPAYVPPPPPKDPNAGLTKDAAESLMSQKLAEADNAQRGGRLADADRLINEAREIAEKNKLEVPERVREAATALEREKAYQEALGRSVKSFCVEDYPKAHVLLLDIERLYPDKKEAGAYIERIFWNLGIEKLQQMEPWEATYYLESLAQRNPADKDAAALLAYAQQFQPGAELGDAYLRRVDPLSVRMAGCN